MDGLWAPSLILAASCQRMVVLVVCHQLLVLSSSFSLITGTMDVKLVQNLLAGTQASLQAFEKSGSDISRIEAHEKAVRLARALEQPRDAILKLSFSVRFIIPIGTSTHRTDHPAAHCPDGCQSGPGHEGLRCTGPFNLARVLGRTGQRQTGQPSTGRSVR